MKEKLFSVKNLHPKAVVELAKFQTLCLIDTLSKFPLFSQVSEVGIYEYGTYFTGE